VSPTTVQVNMDAKEGSMLKKNISTHLRGRLLLYDKHVDVEHFTSERTHTLLTLMF